MEGVWEYVWGFLFSNVIIICKRKDIDSISTYLVFFFFFKSIRSANVVFPFILLTNRRRE